jgi:EmrB/QacA subfamily drug resistance transporter
MFPVAVATVADLYPPSERAKLQGALGAVFSLTSIIGPFLGGYIVDHFTWRWVFYVNLPVGALAMAVTMVNFPAVTNNARKRLDYAGMVLVMTLITSFLLVTFWGGDTYAWDSWQIAGLAALSIGSLAVLVLVERRASDPVLPLPFFKRSVFTFCCLSLMMTAMGLFGVIAFLPLFLQAVVGMSATYSGQVLVPLMMTAMLGAIISGVSIKKTGYKVWLVIGPLISASGLYLLSTLQRGSPWEHTVGYLLVTGLGLGFTMSNYIVAGQNVIDKKQMGAASSTLTLFRAMGGTIGVTVLGVLVNRRMTEELPRHVSPQLVKMLPSTDINTIGGIVLNAGRSGLPGSMIDSLRDALGASIVYIFFISMIIILVAWALSLCIKSVPLKSADEYMNGTKKDPDTPVAGKPQDAPRKDL